MESIKIFSWNWFIWFHEFFFAWTFLIFWSTVIYLLFFYRWQHDTFHLERGGTMSLDFFRIFAGKICSHTWHINQDNGENSRQMFDFMFEFWRYGNLTENFCEWKLFTTPAEEVAEKQHRFKSRFSSKIFVFL